MLGKGSDYCFIPFDTNKYEVKLIEEDFFPHKSPSLIHAVDFLLPVHAEIRAAHKGKVTVAKSDSGKHFTSKEFFNSGLHYEDAVKMFHEVTNAVCIQHKDTFFDYLHFGKDKVYVKEGQEIKEGAIIGELGYSGMFDYMHLHFNAYKRENGKSISIPVKFKPIKIIGA
ncbi:MAG: M23 family metallopeptidase [Candidatus Aenigmatarchaeota archaeon]